MEQLYLAYLALLGELSNSLDQLAGLAKQKNTAIRKDDLLALDQVLNQEQAMSLALRGQEQKRAKLLRELGLEDVPLSGLSERYPPSLKNRAKQAAESLRRSYDVYRCAAEVARTTLECNLHELDKIVSGMGGAPAPKTGYSPAGAAPPPNMRTDFRA